MVLNSLLKLKAFLKLKYCILEFAETRAKKQFWCLKRELKKFDHFNLYA